MVVDVLHRTCANRTVPVEDFRMKTPGSISYPVGVNMESRNFMQLPFDACGDGAGGAGAGGAGVKPGCATVPGPNAKAVVGQQCVFPFEFDGKRYDACTDVTDPDGKRWCSVETDAKQVHQQGRWGYCAAACPGMLKPGCATVPGPNAKAVVGQTCVFPFEFDGKRYDACTDVTDPDGKRWCSVETDAKQVHQQGQWGYCAAACSGMLPPPPPGKCERDMKKNCDSPFGFGVLKIHCPAGATCVDKKCMCQSNTCFVDGICQAR